MASMVAKACSSTSSQMSSMTVQEKGSRNKRKFRAEPPLADPNKIIPLPLNESSSFEFSAEIFDSHVHSNGCDICCLNQDTSDALKLDLGLALTRPREEIEASSDKLNDADWSDFTESELEELVLINLDTIFKSAIKKIIATGYSEEVATNAILRSGLWYGSKDIVSNIVDNTLAFLRSGHEIDPSKEHHFEDLQQMKKYILAELVCLLREIRPFFSTGDAMWCLLICDMNVSQACAMDSDPLSAFVGEASSNLKYTSISAQPQLGTDFKVPETDISIPCKPKSSVAYAQNCPLEPPNLTNSANLKPKASFVVSGIVPDKECQESISNISDKPFSATTEEKFVGSRKVSGLTKRDYILRQKSNHFEKHYRTHGSKGTSRAGKLSAFGGLLLDKNLKGVADSTSAEANKNSSLKNNKSVGFDVPADNANHISLSLPVADTELSLSFPAKTIANPMPISYIDSSNNSSLGKWAHQDRKDETIMKLVPRVKELQNELREWTEWANQKVMQAARRLSKDKAELKALRQEKEEVEKLKKEKSTLEESTIKKLSEMENALCKASGQMERANGAVRRLEFDNSALRREMEAAQLRAAESAASCREVLKREKKTLVKFQSWEKQKSAFQEELSAEKCKLMQLQQKLKQAKDIKDQVETKLNQEVKANHDLLTQATSFRKQRDQIEASAKSKENAIKSKAETNLQNYKTDIQRLEKEISQLRFKTDSSKIAALRNGTDGSHPSKLTELKNIPTLKNDTNISSLEYFGGVKQERECVMCLSEEMCVVFLPCAHQVVCTMCNELHEKQGMKECPSCRGPIQRRVCVRYAYS